MSVTKGRFAFIGLLLLMTPAAAEAGCLCKNYSKDAFCVENIPACQHKAGNCLGECKFNKKPDFPVYEKGPPVRSGGKK